MKQLKKTLETKRRFAIVLEYDGLGFNGWQRQANGYTVQTEIERAIWQGFKEQTIVLGASRTDAGVHAKGQVAAFNLNYNIKPEQLVLALNSFLKRKVRVLKAYLVPLNWNPRKEAQAKIYEYLVLARSIASPLWYQRAWQVYYTLDLIAMQRAAKYLVGKHDFSAFRAAGCNAKHAVRKLLDIKIIRQTGLLKFKLKGEAFVYHMVRNIVGTLVEIGKHKISPPAIKQILLSKERKLAGPTAPAYGLYLNKIIF